MNGRLKKLSAVSCRFMMYSSDYIVTQLIQGQGVKGKVRFEKGL